jgi:hypothetical protein
MKKKIILLPMAFFALLIYTGASAQQANTATQQTGTAAQHTDTATVVVSGGNAVVIAIPQTSSLNSRIVSRSIGDTSNYTPIGTLKPPESFAAFRAIAGDTVILGLKKLKKLSSDKDLWKFIESNPSYTDFSFAMVNLRFLRAIGWAYIDSSLKNQPNGTKLFYKVFDPAKSATDTGSCMTGLQPNERQPLLTARHNSDSIIYLQWGYKITSRVFLPRYAWLYERTFNGTFEKQSVIAYATYTADSVYFGLSQHVLPGRQFTCYIQPVDFFNNGINIHSDTIKIVSVNFKRIPPVQNAMAKDTTSGIFISWKKQASNPFIISLLIQRSTSVAGTYSNIAELAPGDSSYLDKEVVIGQAYYYRLKMMGQQEENVDPVNFSAFASASHSGKHRIPDPPYRLTAGPVTRGIQLSWQAVSSGSLAGYYVFRTTGYDTTQMELISRLINDTTFVDTAKNLSRRINYHYAIKAVSLANIKSRYSATVQAKLPVGIDKPITPAFINITRSNNKLLVEWQNTRSTDNYMSGYVLYKHKIQPGVSVNYDVKNKASAEAARTGWTKVSETLIRHPYFEIAGSGSDDQYDYAVAAVDVSGGESGLSAPANVAAKARPLKTPLKLIVRTMDGGVQLGWLQADTSGLTGYAIYRKELGGKEYKKIITVRAGQSTYTDNDVEAKKVYFYMVRSVNNQEESKGYISNSIKIF